MAIITIGLSCYDQFFFIPQYPEENRKVFSTELLESGGGPCGNASYLLGLWGANVYHITSLKNDIYGQTIINELEKTGINLDYAMINNQQITPLSTILIHSQNASRTIITHKNPNPKIIDAATQQKLDSFIHQLNQEKQPHFVLIDGHEEELSHYILSRLIHKKVVMDAGNVRQSNLNLAKYTDYLVASENFAQDLIQTKNLNNPDSQYQALKQIQAISAVENTPVITLGEKGAVCLENDKVKSYAPYPCQAIDTTGAGDIFHGAFVYGLSQGWALDKIIKFSSLTAALSIEKKGVREAIPSLEQVTLQYMERE